MKTIARLYQALMYLFLYLPLAAMAVFSFNDSKFSLSWKGFTWKWYVKLWYTPTLTEAAWNSLLLAASAATLSCLIGTLAAFLIHQYRFPGRRAMFAMFFVMMMSPDIVIAISLLLLFLGLQIKLGFFTLLLAHVTLCVPFVTTTVYSRFHGLQPEIIEAAQDLGASNSQVFSRVILPIILPAVFAGWLLSFTLSLDDVIISFFTTGPTFEILPLRIYSMVRLGIKPDVNALCVIMLIITVVAILISRQLLKEKQ
ncbi:MAG: spermidine/putrescine ABC transporter permease PotC [Deltaproteobacteria bacterium]|nr:MAG: spermidine/putrescine ABC transporter permease PotC [Deltaproteobacteria bacterium]